MTDRLLRSLSRDRLIRADSRARLLRGGRGQQGQAAVQGVGWLVSPVDYAGQVLNFPPLTDPSTFLVIRAHTDSGVSAPTTFTVRLKRANVVIATATFTLNPGDHDAEIAIAGLGLVCLSGDVLGLVLPFPANPQLTDLSVALGSTN